MKVVRPEWLLESIKASTLLPWRDFRYIPDERQEGSQGSKPRHQQASLITTNSKLPSQPKPKKPTIASSGATSHLPRPVPPSPAKPTVASASGSAVTSRPPAPAPAAIPATAPAAPPKSPAAPPAPAAVPGARPAALDPLYTTDPKTVAEAALVPGYASAISNPNAQRAMSNPEWRKAHTSVSADFIEGYYKNSRLHHLSTWKSELKDLVHEAQERAESGGGGGAGTSGRSVDGAYHIGKVTGEASTGGEGVSMRGAELKMSKSPVSAKWKGKGKAVDDYDRVIMHCDFDCFFVSAGLVSRPELKGKPVVVCHSQGGQGGLSSTSEIASCSYEARKFGLRNGMRCVSSPFSLATAFVVLVAD